MRALGAMPRNIFGIGGLLLLVGCGSELSYPVPSHCLPDPASTAGMSTHPVVAGLEIGIPSEFRRDTTVQYFHGGTRWLDGPREIKVVGGHWATSSFRDFGLPSYSECYDTIGGYEVFVARYVQLENHETQPRGARAVVWFSDPNLSTRTGLPPRAAPGAESARSGIYVGVTGPNAREAEALLRIVAAIN